MALLKATPRQQQYQAPNDQFYDDPMNPSMGGMPIGSDPSVPPEGYHQDVIDQGYDMMGAGRVISTTTSQHPTVVHEQLENQKVLQDIELQLKGYQRDYQTGEPVRVSKEPLINDEGVFKLLIICRSHLDKNTSITDMTDEEIYKTMFDLYLELITFLVVSRHRYAVNKENIGIILRVIVNPIFFTLKRSRGGRQLDAISQITKLMQSTGEEQKAKAGLLSKLGIRL